MWYLYPSRPYSGVQAQKLPVCKWVPLSTSCLAVTTTACAPWRRTFLERLSFIHWRLYWNGLFNTLLPLERKVTQVGIEKYTDIFWTECYSQLLRFNDSSYKVAFLIHASSPTYNRRTQVQYPSYKEKKSFTEAAYVFYATIALPGSFLKGRRKGPTHCGWTMQLVSGAEIFCLLLVDS